MDDLNTNNISFIVAKKSSQWKKLQLFASNLSKSKDDVNNLMHTKFQGENILVNSRLKQEIILYLYIYLFIYIFVVLFCFGFF